jgi:hypothetical protein
VNLSEFANNPDVANNFMCDHGVIGGAGQTKSTLTAPPLAGPLTSLSVLFCNFYIR